MPVYAQFLHELETTISRNGSGVYSLPAATAAVTSETISSTKFNTLTEDLESDANTARPIVAGGTGATSASAARTNLGLAPLEPLLTDPAADRITFWDNSASAFGYLTLGTGLSITTTVLSLDADLSTLAGLTVAADNFIAGNAGGTAWEVKTPANARTSLGLVIGTNVQAWGADLDTYAGTPLTAAELGELQNIGTTTISAAQWGYLGAAGGTIWTSANDGAGSGLDADTLDGVQASAFALLSGANFTGAVDSTAGMTASTFLADAGDGGKLGVWGSATNYVIGMENSYTYGALNGYAMSFTMATSDTQGWIWRKSDQSLSQGAMSLSGAGLLTCGSIDAKPAAGSVTTGTLTYAGNANKATQLTGNPTITGSVFTAGDFLILYAGSAARTITQGASMTMRLDGTATTGNRTLAARGMAVVYMVSATECVVSGSAVS